jgi:hypothetical protein
MTRNGQSAPTFVFLVFVPLLFISGPVGGDHSKKTTKFLDESGHEWQKREPSEDVSDEQMRMVNSDVTQPNQYPYMVRNFIIHY